MTIKSILNSNLNKFILLLVVSLVIFGLWQKGTEIFYQKTLVGITNGALKVIKKDTYITLEKDKKEGFDFMVHTRIQGRKGKYPQEKGSLLEPFIIILSWQIFLFFVMNKKTAVKLALINIAVFVFLQILFLIILTEYYNSDLLKYIFDMMMDNFYIFALILVIKDNMMYPVFTKKHLPE